MADAAQTPEERLAPRRRDFMDRNAEAKLEGVLQELVLGVLGLF